MQIESQPGAEDRSRFSVALVAAGALVLLIVLFFYLFSSGQPGGSREAARLPFGAAEQAYAGRVALGNFSMSRVENFVHQEVTMLSGEIFNDGERPLADIEVTVELHDAMHQVVLRDVRRVLGPGALPLGQGQRREFTISFEHLPADWDRQYPTVRVSGLKFS